MTFEDFISWAEREMKDWREFETLGEVKRQHEGKALRGKDFIAKYNVQQKAMLRKKPWYDEKGRNPIKLAIGKIQTIFERFMRASPTDKITSFYYQIQIWKEAPDK